MIKALLLKPRLERERWVVSLPSAAVCQTMSPFDPEKRIHPPLKLDCNNWERCFYLEWEWLHKIAGLPAQSNFSSSPGDGTIYVWEPYKERPQFDSLRLMALPVDHRGRRKVIATTSSVNLLERLKQNHVFPDGLTSWPDGSTAQMLQLFEKLYAMMRDDAVRYVTQAFEVIDDIV